MNFVAAWLAFVACVSLFSTFMSLIAGSLFFSHAIGVVFLSLGVSILVFLKTPRGKIKSILDMSFFEQAFLIFLIFSVLFHSIYLIYEFDHQIRTLHKNNFGDLTLHVGMIRYLAGASFPPQNPIFIGDDLDYPYAMNMFNAVFEKIGIPTFIHMRWTILISSAVLILLSWQLAGPLFTAIIFFGASSMSLLPGADLNWKNIFLSLWITQRGFLFALPVGLLICEQIIKGVKNPQPPGKLLVLLFAVLPFFHLHTFLVCSLFYWLFVFTYKRWNWVPRGFFTGICALPFVWNSTDGFSKANIAHWQWGWMFTSVLDVARNLGVFPLIFLAFLIWLHREKRKERTIFGVFFLCWLLFFNLMLAPWAWDNIKLLIWPFLAMSLLVCMELEARFSRAKLVLLLPVFFLGMLEVYQSWPVHKKSVSLIHVAKINQWSSLLSGKSLDQRIGTFPTFNHPVSFLGFGVVMGYPGHLWSHGISYADVDQKLKDFYIHKADFPEVTMFAFGDLERTGFKTPTWGRTGFEMKKNGGAVLYEHNSSTD